MALEQRPSFHEVRGLGSRIYLAHGMADAASQSLMNPFEPENTKIYLDGGAKILTHDDALPVTAPGNAGSTEEDAIARQTELVLSLSSARPPRGGNHV